MDFVKRIGLFILTNLAVLVLVGIVLFVLEGVFGIEISPTVDSGYGPLLAFAAVWGFAGSLFSLATSRMIAKWTYGITPMSPANLMDYSERERLVYATVEGLARQHGIAMPEVGVYDSPDANAFATGPTKNRSLVAVSTGLLETMTPAEVEGVIAHEMAHILNGDMVTMTLLQGVLNTFVIFFARIAGYAVDRWLSRGEEESSSGYGIGYHVTVIVLEILLGILASLILMAYSRAREYRADAGSARMVGKDRMIAALRKLKTLTDRTEQYDDGKLATMKIAAKGGWLSAFSSHPDLDDRIAALERDFSI